MDIFEFINNHTTGESHEEYGARDKLVRRIARKWLFGVEDESKLSPWKIKIIDTYHTFAMGVLSEYLTLVKLSKQESKPMSPATEGDMLNLDVLHRR